MSAETTSVACSETPFPQASVARRDGWKAWPPEQLWLWPDPSQPAVRGRMRARIAEALGLAGPANIERVTGLAEAREPAAALRLCARLLHAQHGGQLAHDLAACALLLGVLEYRDERAAVEFTGLALRRASRADEKLARDNYPPPLDQPRRLRRRLFHQLCYALNVLATGANWPQAVGDLGRLGQGDPLAGTDEFGQPRAWDPRL